MTAGLALIFKFMPWTRMDVVVVRRPGVAVEEARFRIDKRRFLQQENALGETMR